MIFLRKSRIITVAFFFPLFEKWSHIVQAGFELAYVGKKGLELLTSCLGLLSAEIAGMCHHTWLGSKREGMRCSENVEELLNEEVR